MTRNSRDTNAPDGAGGEPMLQEMATFRRLVALETAPGQDKQHAFAGARREVLTRSGAHARWGVSRPWGIALLALGTSTALAATPPGRLLASDARGAISDFLTGEAKTGGAAGADTPLSTQGTARREGRATLVQAAAPEQAGDTAAASADATAAKEGGTRLTPTPDLPASGVQHSPSNAPSAGAPRPAPAKEREAKKLEAEERKLVEHARFALGQKRYGDAQAFSREHRLRFPHGQLEPERDAIERQVAQALAQGAPEAPRATP